MSRPYLEEITTMATHLPQTLDQQGGYPSVISLRATGFCNVNQQLHSLELGYRAHFFTDIDYAERVDFAFDSEQYFVGEPRSVYLSVKGQLF